jgi:hypothetical protein
LVNASGLAEKMPHKQPKALRLGKVAGKRRVYVSWLEPEKDTLKDANRIKWKDELMESLAVESRGRENFFEMPLQTGDIPPGYDNPKQWLQSKLDEMMKDKENKKGGITDVVGVLTRAYLKDNQDVGGQPAEGELAKFFDFALSDRNDRLRVFLAPLEQVNWRNCVRAVELGDLHRKWLDRLKAERYTWPGDTPGGKYLDEIEDAVSRIFDRPVKR